ncbi:MAG: putative addiction module antidote protein [Burkholderiaceae bacterium]|jgi:probable addiction module antidote protein|nr:putative addiction module antidote protein [Burkholderiaceae bacterium]
MTTKTIPFDIASELESEEAIAEYLRQVFEDGDSDEIIRAIGHAAHARGMSQLAKNSGLGRENLYNALKPGAKPRFDTILRVCRAMGVNLEPRLFPTQQADAATTQIRIVSG